MRYEARPISDGEGGKWDAFVAAHPYGEALLTTDARQHWLNSGWSFRGVGAFSNGDLVGGVALCVKRMPHLPWSVARLQAILADQSDIANISCSLLTAVASMGRSLRVVEVESRCRIPDPQASDSAKDHAGVLQALQAARYVETSIRRGTYLVRIDVDDESLLRSYSSKCRRDVRKGLREGVTVTSLERPQDFEMFCDAQKEMCVRKGLAAPDSRQCESFRPMFEKGHFRLFGACYQDQICNMAIVDALGVPRYALGATTSAALQKGTPPTGQALHYGIMQWLRERGVRYYDLGGSPGPVPQKGHPNYSVWRFKCEFGGPFVRMMPYHRLSTSLVGRFLLLVGRRLGKLT